MNPVHHGWLHGLSTVPAMYCRMQYIMNPVHHEWLHVGVLKHDSHHVMNDAYMMSAKKVLIENTCLVHPILYNKLNSHQFQKWHHHLCYKLNFKFKPFQIISSQLFNVSQLFSLEFRWQNYLTILLKIYHAIIMLVKSNLIQKCVWSYQIKNNFSIFWVNFPSISFLIELANLFASPTRVGKLYIYIMVSIWK